ncbi:hypothetical protein ACIP3A_32990 [Streptomyces tricolor]
MLGFSDRHLSQPVRPRTEFAEGFARTVSWHSALNIFIKIDRLPRVFATG